VWISTTVTWCSHSFYRCFISKMLCRPFYNCQSWPLQFSIQRIRGHHSSRPKTSYYISTPRNGRVFSLLQRTGHHLATGRLGAAMRSLFERAQTLLYRPLSILEATFAQQNQTNTRTLPHRRRALVGNGRQKGTQIEVYISGAGGALLRAGCRQRYLDHRPAMRPNRARRSSFTLRLGRSHSMSPIVTFPPKANPCVMPGRDKSLRVIASNREPLRTSHVSRMPPSLTPCALPATIGAHGSHGNACRSQ
jgi:hypothetical protein